MINHFLEGHPFLHTRMQASLILEGQYVDC